MDLSRVYCHSFVKLNSIKYYILIFNSELIHALINQGIDNGDNDGYCIKLWTISFHFSTSKIYNIRDKYEF